jgi:hypothetical protein
LDEDSESELCCVPRRDREDREREAREAEEREALKNMTDAERRAWEAAHPKVSPGVSAGGSPENKHQLCVRICSTIPSVLVPLYLCEPSKYCC